MNASPAPLSRDKTSVPDVSLLPPLPGTPQFPSVCSTTSAGTLAAFLKEGGTCLILDVRTAPEFEAAHIAGSVNQPLDRLNPADWRSASTAGSVYIFCQAGGRAGRAGEILAKAGVSNTVIEGGMDAWTAAGFAVERGSSKVLPLMRQVQIAIGLVAGTGSALAIFKHPMFGLIPLFTSAGLLFAGLTGTCGLAILLARMPWNRRSQPAGTTTEPSCCAPHAGPSGAGGTEPVRSASSVGGAR